MPVITHIEIIRDEGVANRTHGQLMRDTLRHVAVRHLHRRLGDHYQPNSKTRPGGEYGYEQRESGYLRRKQRKQGHALPLVFTGHLRRFARNNSQISATRNRSRIRLKSPHILRRQQWEELSAIAPSEHAEIAGQAVEYYTREAARPKNRRKRKRRI